MKELTIISGKGGTGKTTLTAAFCGIPEKVIVSDCDVEASDLHLLLHPQVKERSSFSNGFIAEIQQQHCTRCGICADACAFGAINRINSLYSVDPIDCEGCGLCYRICPEEAVKFEEEFNSRWFVSAIANGQMVHATMGAGEENSGKLVAQLRKKAREIAEEYDFDLILNDGPPGIGCPVISSVTGTDGLLIITEPTLSGKHDLLRVLELSSQFSLKPMVLINKYDLNPGISNEIEAFAEEHGVFLAGKIPFEEKIVEAMEEEKTLTEYLPEHPVSLIIEEIWGNVRQKLDES
jgi:MinD superfamily P-loop ATPase